MAAGLFWNDIKYLDKGKAMGKTMEYRYAGLPVSKIF